MPILDKAHIASWAKDSEFEDDQRAVEALSHLKTSMTDAEKDHIDQVIAKAQFDADPEADVVDAHIIIETLKEHGFHPAFEYEGVIVAQHALEALQEAERSPSL